MKEPGLTVPNLASLPPCERTWPHCTKFSLIPTVWKNLASPYLASASLPPSDHASASASASALASRAAPLYTVPHASCLTASLPQCLTASLPHDTWRRESVGTQPPEAIRRLTCPAISRGNHQVRFLFSTSTKRGSRRSQGRPRDTSSCRVPTSSTTRAGALQGKRL